MPNACGRMLAVALATFLGIILPFISNTVLCSSEAHAMHATAKHAGSWGIGADVCVRTGHWRLSVHVQGAPAPKCACAVERN